MSPFLMMPFQVYIIYSAKLDKYYVGYAENLVRRLEQHNSGISTFTARANDWVLKWNEEQPDRNAAMKKEKLIKQKKARNILNG